MTASQKKRQLYIPTASWDDNENVEASNTIIRRVGGGKLIATDALTNDGWLRSLGIECDEEMREQLIEQMSQSRAMTWKVSKPTTYFVPVSLSAPKTPPQPPEWIESHDEILQRLEAADTRTDEYEKALLIAEITDFADDKVDRLLNALEKYITANRFASSDDSVVLLGCAIRKYAMNMKEEHFNDYAKWLQPTETDILDTRVELELVKGFDSRISYARVALDGHDIDDTISIIGEVCDEYSSRRRLLKENHASIAVEANHAIVLLNLLAGNVDKANEEFDRAKKLDPDWVAELIVEQLAETAEGMEDRESGIFKRIFDLLNK